VLKSFWHSGLARLRELGLATLSSTGWTLWIERPKCSWLTRRDNVELFKQVRIELEFGV